MGTPKVRWVVPKELVREARTEQRVARASTLAALNCREKGLRQKSFRERLWSGRASTVTSCQPNQLSTQTPRNVQMERSGSASAIAQIKQNWLSARQLHSMFTRIQAEPSVQKKLMHKQTVATELRGERPTFVLILVLYAAIIWLLAIEERS